MSYRDPPDTFIYSELLKAMCWYNISLSDKNIILAIYSEYPPTKYHYIVSVLRSCVFGHEINLTISDKWHIVVGLDYTKIDNIVIPNDKIIHGDYGTSINQQEIIEFLDEWKIIFLASIKILNLKNKLN